MKRRTNLIVSLLLLIGLLYCEDNQVIQIQHKYNQCDIVSMKNILESASKSQNNVIGKSYIQALYAYAIQDTEKSLSLFRSIYEMLERLPRDGVFFSAENHTLIYIQTVFYLALISPDTVDYQNLAELADSMEGYYHDFLWFRVAQVNLIRLHDYSKSSKILSQLDMISLCDFINAIYTMKAYCYYSQNKLDDALGFIEESISAAASYNQIEKLRSLIWKAIILNRMGRENDLRVTVMDIRDYMTEYGYSEINDCYASMIMGQPLTGQEREDINNIRELVMEAK